MEYIMQIEKEIEELSAQIEQIRNEIEKYLKMGNVFGVPFSMTGIDYTREKVQSSGMMAFGDVIKKIGEKENILRPYMEKLRMLRKIQLMFLNLQKQDQDTIEAEVCYLRFVKKYTQRKTADKLGYSERQIQRIEKKLKERAVGKRSDPSGSH